MSKNKTHIKIVFFGTPDYVIPIADNLNKAFRTSKEKGVVGVVTQAPKPSGRDQKIERSEVDHWAYKNKIPIHYDFKKLPEADIGVVASYGQIIPQKAIDHFPYGILNIHPSLLPKYRGASPVQATIVAGEEQTGVTVIKMDEQMDHGPTVSAFRETLGDLDTTKLLRDRLFERTADFIVPLVLAFYQGKILPKPQYHEEATFTKTITKEDAYIDPSFIKSALEGKTKRGKWKISFVKGYETDPSPEFIERFIRAMQPWPTAWTKIKILSDKDIKILRLKILHAHVEDKKLVLDEVQLEGKNKVTWNEFKNGYPKAKFE